MREFVKGIKAGQDYRELPDVIAINIVDFEFLPAEQFHTCFHLREDSESEIMLTNSLEIHFLDMVKYRREVRKGVANTPLTRWMAWLNEKSPPELIAEVIKMDSAIQVADERMVYVTGDDEAIRAYEMRQMGLSDYTSSMNYAREEGHRQGHAAGMAEGHAQGMAEGHAEEKLEIARKMKEMGDSLERIHAITSLPVETITQL